jgi:chromosome segregation ATPase
LEGLLMSVESLTYADLADRLGTTQEAARSLVRRLRLPRQTGNDGKVRINIDLAEIQYKPQPARAPSGHQPDIETLKAQIAGLQDELKNLEAENSMIRSSAAGHRADFERERDRYDSLMIEVLKQTAAAMSARETAARLEGQLTGRRSRGWWKRLVARQQASTAALAPGRA